MLLGFRIKNFRSIADDAFIDFRARTSLKEHDYVLHDIEGVKVLPVVSIYGANGSGKSNIITAFLYFKFLVVGIRTLSSNLSLQKTLTVDPFIFGTNQSMPTEMEAYFSCGKKEYRYGFAIKDNEIVEECLFERTLSSKTETKWKVLFERDEKSVYFGSGLSGFEVYGNQVDKNKFMFSFLGRLDIEQANKFNSLLFEIYKVFSFSSPFLATDIKEINEEYFSNNELLNELNGFLKLADPTIDEVQIEYDEYKKEYTCFTVRNGTKAPFDIESDGTKKLYSLFWLIYDTLESGYILAVDELDCQIHPLLFRKIVRMFHDKETNKKGAQLIFTSHNIVMFDSRDFRRDEIWFAEKDEIGRTTIFSLADFEYSDKRIGADLDYGKNYLSGRFGAVPFMAGDDADD